MSSTTPIVRPEWPTADFSYQIPAREYQLRIEAYRHLLQDAELNAGIISTDNSIFYLTGIGYHPLERPFFLVISANPDEPSRLLVPKMERGHFEKALRDLGIKNISILEYAEYKALAGQNWEDQLSTMLQGLKGVAVESGIPADKNETINRARTALGQPVTVLTDFVEQLRQIKSPREIAILEQAGYYADLMLSDIFGSSYNGAPVAQLFALARATQNKIFADVYARGDCPDVLRTKALCAAWPSRFSDQPHYIPTLHDRLGPGSNIAFAFPTVAGLWAEVERTYFVQPPSDQETHYFNIMMRARAAALAMVMPGKTGAEIDTAAHEIFDQEQVLPHVLHRTGHGLGLEHHEAPYSSAGDHTRLEPGMVVSVEPGIYVPKVGGFRHSDTVLVTNNGYRLLTRTPTDIDSMTIHNGWFRETRNRLVGRLVEKSLHFPPQELPMQPGASLMARGGCLGNPLRHTSVAMPLMTSGLMFCRPC